MYLVLVVCLDVLTVDPPTHRGLGRDSGMCPCPAFPTIPLGTTHGLSLLCLGDSGD